MYELLYAFQGRPRPVYPDSGPGPKKLLYGDESKGYFGEVSAAEMSVSDGITDLLFFKTTGAGFALSEGVTWIKYFYKGKVVFVPTSLCGRVKYDDLENAKATYGVTRSVKPTVLPVSGKPMYTENAIISGGEDTLMRVRLMDASNTSTTVPANVGYATLSGTEVSDLWLSRMPGTIAVNPFGLPRRDMNVSALYAIKPTSAEAASASTVPSYEVTNPGSVTSAASLPVGSAMAWRPILELVPRSQQGSVLSPLTSLKTTSTATQTNPSVSVMVDNALKTLEHFSNKTPVVIFSATVANSGLFAPVLTGKQGDTMIDYATLS